MYIVTFTIKKALTLLGKAMTPVSLLQLRVKDPLQGHVFSVGLADSCPRV